MLNPPYIGSIFLFAGDFAPAGWAICDGSLISIAENDTLFQLIGTTFGGDGQETFALPDLRGRVPLHFNQGPGLSNYILGQSGGIESVTLAVNQMPVHSHVFGTATGSPLASSAAGTTNDPVGNVPAVTTGINSYNTTGAAKMGPGTAINITTGSAGGGQPFSVLSPVLPMNYIISLFGIFPSS
jgi:microcystin-dependent protein